MRTCRHWRLSRLQDLHSEVSTGVLVMKIHGSRGHTAELASLFGIRVYVRVVTLVLGLLATRLGVHEIGRHFEVPLIKSKETERLWISSRVCVQPKILLLGSSLLSV